MIAEQDGIEEKSSAALKALLKPRKEEFVRREEEKFPRFEGNAKHTISQAILQSKE